MMSSKRVLKILIKLFSVVLCCTQFACQSKNDEDVKMLKEGQASIKKDIEEIKKHLQIKATPTPIDPKTITLRNLNGEPLKGDKAARLAIIEFSDYQ